MSSQLLNETKQGELNKVIERENVISYKKKQNTQGKGKDVVKSYNHSDQDSLSGKFSEDVNLMKNVVFNNPLPQLAKDKLFRKRFISKYVLAQEVRTNSFHEKEVRQHDNLMLKQKNNFLASENMKLKTKVCTLEKENVKLQRMLEEDPSKSKTPGLISASGNKERFRQSENLSTKILMKSLKKQLEDIKKENNGIKSSIKFTTITELEYERDTIFEETNRLRTMLEEEQTRRISLKVNQQGMSYLEQRVMTLQDRNNVLARENHDLNNRLKKNGESGAKTAKNSETQKNLNKMLFNARRSLKEREKEVDQLREQVKTSACSIPSVNNLVTSDKSMTSSSGRKSSGEKPGPSVRNFDRRTVSKSAKKSVPNDSIASKCKSCEKYITENESLKKKIQQIQNEAMNSNPLVIPTQPVKVPSEEQTQDVIRFIQFRFKAHHLTVEESEKYLLNSENVSEQQMENDISLQQFVETVISEPFVILNKRYIEIFLMKIFYAQEIAKIQNRSIKLDKGKIIKKKAILQSFRKLIPALEIITQAKQEEMFLQIAQLVTSYNQHMLAALNNRKNGQGTISEKEMTAFFIEIELEKDYIDFIITQIILESMDLEKLNFYAFFQIFNMPKEEIDELQQQGQPISVVNKKKRFQVEHVVKEQDEEYEESKSMVDNSRHKSVSKQEQSETQNNEGIFKIIFFDKDAPLDQETDQFPLKQKSSKIKEMEKSAVTVGKAKEDNEETIKDEYDQDGFEEENMNGSIGYEQVGDQKPKNEDKKKKKQDPKKLIDSQPYEIEDEDIADQYDEAFEN